MTLPRDRGRAPRRGWVPTLLLGAVLAGCSGTAPGPAAPSGSTSPAPPTDAAATTGARPEAATRTASPAVDCGLTLGTDGRQVIRYCGEGTATVELPLRTLELQGVECDVRGSFATVNVGVSHEDPETATHDYLGLVVGGLQEGRETTADHLAVELVVRGTTLPLHGQEATVDLTGDGEMRVTVEALTEEDGPVRMALRCPTQE